MQLPPLSLYVHIPWCVRKCPYCDFNSHASRGELPEQQYLNALRADLQQELPAVQGRKLTSIFIGGGTPSLFSARGIADILEAAEQLIGFEQGVEITLEANPGTLETGRYRDYRAAGVNRLSIGIQSFNSEHLLTLGRIHSGEQALAAVASAVEAGFDNFNLDLMHGLPNQSEAQAMSDLRQALALQPAHISWYQLTIEPNTEFWSKPPTLPDDDHLDAIQQAGHQLLAENGYQQYEVSAYARDNRPSKHNLNYWQFGDYLGIGAGAHGKVTWPQQARIERRSKTRQPDHYMARQNSHLAGSHEISNDELPVEFMMNALRLRQGVPQHLFTDRTGLPPDTIAKAAHRLQQQGLLEPDSTRHCTTALGYRFLNSVLQAFS